MSHPYRGEEPESGRPLLVVPIVHGRLEPAKRVRAELARFQPTAVAVEIPETLATPFSRAVARLPLLSILRWKESGGRLAYLLVEPTDGAVEAARYALEHQLALCCADRDTEGYEAHDDLVPDTWALERLPPRYFDELCRAGLRAPAPPAPPPAISDSALGFPDAARRRLPIAAPDNENLLREATMAFHVRRLLDEGHRVALVCGAAHAESVQARIEDATTRPIGRTRRDAELFHLAEEASREVLSEPPFLQAAWERHRASAPRLEPSLPPVDSPTEKPREISGRLAQIIRLHHKRVTGDFPAVPAPPPAAAPAPVGPPEPEPERYALIARLARAAARRHLAEDGTRIGAKAIGVFLRMARNWSRLAGRLSPDLVQLVTCARGVGGDDFAWRLWELATHWPFQTERPGLPVLRPTVEELYRDSARLRFRLSQRSRRHLQALPQRPREKRPGEWKDAWKGDGIVSYPPEDLVIEGYGAFLRQRAVGLVASEQSRVEPFTASLRDGIDLRETIRNLAHDGRIYVREERPVKGAVGAVILIFDEDPEARRHPWTMTWQGEHGQESDMAFYATRPGGGGGPGDGRLVGPGISRCQYGGLLMTLPPGRMFNVFEDPFFAGARDKPERLLIAGIDYSQEKLIVYAAPKPPRSALTALAARQGKKVLYVPLGQLSPILLRKVRTFHVLDGRPVRDYAATYVRP